MFLNELNDTERIVLYRLAEYMAHADGVLAPEEDEMLENLRQDLDVDIRQAANVATVEPEAHCALITRTSAHAIVLLEIASMAHVDGDYDQRERQLLHQIAELWGVERLTVYRIEEWARTRNRLVREAIEIKGELAKNKLNAES